MEFKAIVDPRARSATGCAPSSVFSREAISAKPPRRLDNEARRPGRKTARRRGLRRQGGRFAAADPGERIAGRAHPADRPRAEVRLWPQAVPQVDRDRSAGAVEDRRRRRHHLPCRGHPRRPGRAVSRADRRRGGAGPAVQDPGPEDQQEAQGAPAQADPRRAGRCGRGPRGPARTRRRRGNRQRRPAGAGPREPAAERLHAELPRRPGAAPGPRVPLGAYESAQ